MIKPTKFVSEEMPKLMAYSNELVNNKQVPPSYHFWSLPPTSYGPSVLPRMVFPS